MTKVDNTAKAPTYTYSVATVGDNTHPLALYKLDGSQYEAYPAGELPRPIAMAAGDVTFVMTAPFLSQTVPAYVVSVTSTSAADDLVWKRSTTCSRALPLATCATAGPVLLTQAPTVADGQTTAQITTASASTVFPELSIQLTEVDAEGVAAIAEPNITFSSTTPNIFNIQYTPAADKKYYAAVTVGGQVCPNLPRIELAADASEVPAKPVCDTNGAANITAVSIVKSNDATDKRVTVTASIKPFTGGVGAARLACRVEASTNGGSYTALAPAAVTISACAAGSASSIVFVAAPGTDYRLAVTAANAADKGLYSSMATTCYAPISLVSFFGFFCVVCF